MRLFITIFLSLMAYLLIASRVLTYQSFPDTDQTMCYDSGYNAVPCDTIQPGDPYYYQDAHYQSRLFRSYSKLGHGGVELSDGTMHVVDGGPWIMTRDNVTGLIWELKANNKDVTYTWQDAQDVFISYLKPASFGGFTDWRLPSVTELSSLVNSNIPSPGSTIDGTSFPNTVSSYWSSTTRARNADFAVRAHCSYCFVDSGGGKSARYSVRSVSAGQATLYVLARVRFHECGRQDLHGHHGGQQDSHSKLLAASDCFGQEC